MIGIGTSTMLTQLVRDQRCLLAVESQVRGPKLGKSQSAYRTKVNVKKLLIFDFEKQVFFGVALIPAASWF